MTIPQDAVESAKEAMREVTPPPGASKADWLAEHGGFALIAGAIAAAAPHIQAQALRDAADDYSVNLTVMSGPRIREWLKARADQINPEAKEPR